MVTILDVWINCPSSEVAHQISEALVAERLAACTNTFAEIQSAFHWKGNVARETEVPLLVKTREELFDTLCERVKQLHPYETPGIMAVEIKRVNRDYAEWVLEETRGSGP